MDHKTRWPIHGATLVLVLSYPLEAEAPAVEAPAVEAPAAEAPAAEAPAAEAPAAETPEQRGDRAFADRAAGFLNNGVPDPLPTEFAVAAYEQALASDPDSLRLLFKLMEALYFQGYHLPTEKEDQREIYERLVVLATRATELVAEKTRRADDLAELPLAEQASVLGAVPEAAEAHYWATASWGLWGMTHSALAAVRKGVATKVRNHSRLVILLDEGFENAAGLRMAGRLHTQAPRVPFFTYWIDRSEGLDMLRRAVEISRRDPRNLLFLAEAILDYDRNNRAQAFELLREIVRRGPHPDELVEQSETVEMARQLLADLEEDR